MFSRTKQANKADCGDDPIGDSDVRPLSDYHCKSNRPNSVAMCCHITTLQSAVSSHHVAMSVVSSSNK